MKQKNPYKRTFWIHLLVITNVLTLMQGYWALWDYRDRISSGCLDCAFITDLLFSGMFTFTVLTFFNLSFIGRRLTKKKKVLLNTLVIMGCWYLMNTEIFYEREASWSTYSNIWLIGIIISFVPVIVIGGLFGVIYYFIINRNISKKKLL